VIETFGGSKSRGIVEHAAIAMGSKTTQT